MGLFDKLRTPKWKHKDWKKRRDAVKKLDDLEILIQIAKYDPNNYVRSEAINKINDESVLKDIARTDSHGTNRLKALQKINDESILADIAIHNTFDEAARFVGIDAVAKINDEALLCNIIQRALTDNVVVAALKKINDEDVLMDLYKTSNKHVSELVRRRINQIRLGE